MREARQFREENARLLGVVVSELVGIKQALLDIRCMMQEKDIKPPANPPNMEGKKRGKNKRK